MPFQLTYRNNEDGTLVPEFIEVAPRVKISSSASTKFRDMSRKVPSYRHMSVCSMCGGDARYATDKGNLCHDHMVTVGWHEATQI